MYSILYETDESTAVNLSAYGKFLPGVGKQLVTVGAKCLKFYRANPYAVFSDGSDEKKWSQTTRLECLLSFSLMAPVRSMSVARVPLYPECDSLIMSFDDAKLSIVNIDPKQMSLNTLSLHSIEDDFLRDGYMKDNFSPDLCVDPGQRCAAFLVYGHHLGIVPFLHSSKDQHLHSYTVPLRNFDEHLDTVTDMAFLDGYYEPTILFMYEPIKTTAGRASVRYDTISILGVSLNVKDRVHAIVWNFAGLPMTVDRLLPMPLPIGGICLFGANEIIYLNQSVPPCGIAVNSCADETTKFPLSDFRNMKIRLDGCIVQVENLNNIFIGLKTGDLYMLTLVVDTANTVKNLKLRKVLDIPIPCTITTCSPGYVFVGSRLGDSVFLQYTRESKAKTLERTSRIKKSFFGTTVVEVEQESRKIANDDDDFLYTDEPSISTVVANNSAKEANDDVDDHTFIFHKLDSLLNVGPCKVVKCCRAIQSELSGLAFNLVTASGHGNDASLCFFERTIRPDVVTTSPLDDAVQFWTVGKYEDDKHRYLIIAKEMSTLVLELENDMVELETPLFLTSETTIAAGELASGRIAVQVTAMNIVLVLDDRQLSLINIETNFPVVAASIVDPFVVVMVQNGRVILYRLMQNDNTNFHLAERSLVGKLRHEKTPATAVCIFKDISGIVQLCSEGRNGLSNEYYRVGSVVRSSSRLSAEGAPIHSEMKEELTDDRKDDDIDELLYGDQTEQEFKPTRKAQKRKIMDEDQEWTSGRVDTNVQDPNCVLPTFWMCITRENGNLYIYSICDVQLVYMVKKFNLLHDVLYDDPASAYEDQQYPTATTSLQGEGIELNVESSVTVKPEDIIVELHVFGMGLNQGRPVLSALVDDIVVFYEMFGYDEGVEGHLAIRFRRLHCSVITRSHRFVGQDRRAPVEAARDNERHRSLIHPFERVGKIRNGIFICGGYPSVLLMERGEPRLHPMTISGPICSFAPFDNANCENGFLYLTSNERELKISLLRADVVYDASYPVRKIPLHSTVHFVSHMKESDLYGVVTSVGVPNPKLCTLNNEEKQIDTCERDENFALPTMDRYTLKLFSAEDWCFVPDTELEFDEFEVVTCSEEVLLTSESTITGMQNYLAVGTAVNYGEEVFVRGRIILLEIIDVVPEEGKPTSRHRLKTVYDKEQKGPVTSMCHCNGYLLTGMGQKIFIWQYKDGELNGVSFLDLHFYVNNLVGFRNLAVACDLYRSLSLLRYQEEYKALSLVSRDLRPSAPAPMAAHFLVDGSHLGFVLSDEDANVTLFNYLPETKESMGGERLIIRATINIGSVINSFVRVKGHASECFIENKFQVKETQTCIFGTLDGSFGIVRPLTEKIFRRLHMLQQVMISHVPQPAGLHPRGSRSARSITSSHSAQQISSARNIVDGNLIFQYLNLSTLEKKDVARKAVTNRYQIMDDLIEIQRIITPY